MPISKILQNLNWRIIIAMMVIVIVGIVTLISVSESVSSGVISIDKEVSNQISFVVIGLFIILVLLLVDYNYLRYIPLQIINAILIFVPLILVLMIGTTRGNATRWFSFGTVTLQPSEFAKPLLVIFVAFITTQLDRLSEFYKGLFSVVTGIIVSALIVIQPNLSTALIVLAIIGIMFLVYTKHQLQWFATFLSIIFYILIFSGVMNFGFVKQLIITIFEIKIDLLLLLVLMFANIAFSLRNKEFRLFAIFSIVASLVLLLSSSFIYNSVLKPYQRDRITAFLGTGSEQNKVKFQSEQAKVAIGSGGLFGKGFAQGTQSKLHFLPEHKTDFIFASFAEEFGLIGSVFLLVLYLVLILEIISVGMHTSDEFGFLICVGIATMFFLEIFINIGVNVAILPATGVALPFMSLGGSSMWAKFLSLGIVESIAIYGEKYKGEKTLTLK